VKSFLRAFQIHVFQQGMPSRVFSDLGSQIVPGVNIITDWLRDLDTQCYLRDNGVQTVKFEQYFKGNSSLGSLVEVCVKMVKRLIFEAVRNLILAYHDFEKLLNQTRNLVNQRPVALHEPLRDSVPDVPEPITPGILIHGRTLVSPGFIPSYCTSDEDYAQSCTRVQSITKEFAKITKTRDKLVSIYNDEFAKQLLDQAVDQKGRYSPVNHVKLQIGDIVLLKEEHCKIKDYPLAKVCSVVQNDIGEVTGVTALKGKTRETVKRHVKSVIPYLMLSSKEPC
jgi:hypothetical protein